MEDGRTYLPALNSAYVALAWLYLTRILLVNSRRGRGGAGELPDESEGGRIK